MDLPTMRTRVRRDLRDEDAANYRWTDAEIDRHIGRAVQEVSLAAPLEASATLTTTAGSRELSIAALTSRVSVEAAEYPAGQYPPCLVPFTTWADTLTLLIDGAPLDGEIGAGALREAAHARRRRHDAARPPARPRGDGRGGVRRRSSGPRTPRTG